MHFVSLFCTLYQVSQEPQPKLNSSAIRTMLFNIQTTDETPFDLRGLQSAAFRYEFPSFRYKVWDVIDDPTKTQAIASKYDADSWNYVTFNEVENLCYETLSLDGQGVVTIQGQITPLQSAVTNMGFTEDVWDCFVNHYIDYDWSDLVEKGIQAFVMDLGWTEQMWMSLDGTSAPASEDLYWDELSQTQRDAAQALCYFEETWNGELSMDQWPALPTTAIRR